MSGYVGTLVTTGDPMTGEAGSPAGGTASLSNRLILARRVVLWSFTSLPLCIVAVPLLGIVGSPEPIAFAVTDVVGVAACVAVALLCLRIMWARTSYPAAVSRRDIALSMLTLAALIVVEHDRSVALFAASLWWATVMVTSSTKAKVGYTLVLIALLVGLGLLQQGVISWAHTALAGLSYGGFASIALLANWSVLRLWDIVNEAFAARDARARLAVTEERLRFARDLHDLIGHSLSGIAVRSELAARLATPSAERAAEEMVSVQSMARDGLREMRRVVDGYRDVDVVEEIGSVRAVLAAAGTRCTVSGDEAELPGELRALAAWVVREGATNVLRHSAARLCDIALKREDRAIIVEVHNDGVTRNDDGSLPYGTGLTGLNERVVAAGGTLSARGTIDGGFLLRVVLPAPPSSSRSVTDEKGGTT
ncbi:MAG: sensor histidine kinase [Egibacteraceae bacterium]